MKFAGGLSSPEIRSAGDIVRGLVFGSEEVGRSSFAGAGAVGGNSCSTKPKLADRLSKSDGGNESTVINVMVSVALIYG